MPLQSKYGLENHGITNICETFWNFNTPRLYEEIIKRREGVITHLGPIAVRTGSHTARAANDKFIVKEPSSENNIWWGKVNRPFEEVQFKSLYLRLLAYLQGKNLFIQDCYTGADPVFRKPIRIVTETAWHNLFARNMFIQARWEELESHIPEFTVLSIPYFHAIPEVDGTNSEAFIIIHFGKKMVIIGGTAYAGEIKKSIFTISNYLLPQEHVMTMHSSANIGKNGDTAIFFGLSGTGKTTLSTDPDRRLIGDDEHGWSDRGVFNFEGGCYAKVINLTKESEPEIYECTRKFGTILENVAYNPDTRRLDLADASLTENTRAAYPITHIPSAEPSKMGGHPENIIMLTADAFGIMPPISRLTPEQTLYHFVSGYTAKIGGTEAGIGKEPKATFSACFGAPFMALHPYAYARLLKEKIEKHAVKCWLVNTGWVGGPYGTGNRIALKYTRQMVKAALNGTLEKSSFVEENVFGLKIPEHCEGVPDELLIPSKTWKNQAEYIEKAKILAQKFRENFKQFENDCETGTLKAGPKI
ncbi:MAG: phosphoenolpyruvate carboxykinase (ATP) [Candidatus Schekmanbacteria bacterium RBG_13_48_7]|uniref:Phosphoenolpyruvate carboxykinase (ATP) n=1 Tax=Candidatus Schekmanbacteria bacterium RBG_13_48_7 TaxID=1817878 RepID=A0A1F7RZR6_9BACT|nr:MAG: phosphoenolpyruvate carboxykinase (ATP) [Candidatus Schekmanbacteria bacterium RBG_13_48_7]